MKTIDLEPSDSSDVNIGFYSQDNFEDSMSPRSDGELADLMEAEDELA